MSSKYFKKETIGDNLVRTRHIRYFLQKVEIKDYNVMIDGRNLFDHPFRNSIKTYENIRNTTIKTYLQFTKYLLFFMTK